MRKLRLRLTAVPGLFFSLCLVASAETQAQDPEFARLVREWTTKPEFLSPLVDHLPVVPGIPSPAEILGHHIGAPKKLTYYADLLSYYKALAAKSSRVRMVNIGKTDEGRDCVVFIAAEAVLSGLMSNPAEIRNRPGIVDVRVGKGRVLLFATNPCYRWLNHGEFNLLFNTILHYNNLGRP